MMPAMIRPMMSTGDPFHRLRTALFPGIAGVPVRPRAQSSMGIIAQLRSADSCSGVAVPSGRGRRTAFPVPPATRTHRPAGHGKPIQACDQSTTCLQSQVGQDRHLGKRGSAQVTVAMVLSVGVRSVPVATVVNGTAAVSLGSRERLCYCLSRSIRLFALYRKHSCLLLIYSRSSTMARRASKMASQGTICYYRLYE